MSRSQKNLLLLREGAIMLKSNLNVAMASTLPTVSEMRDDDNCWEEQEDEIAPNMEEKDDDLGHAIEEISHATELEDPLASQHSSCDVGDVGIDNRNAEAARNGVTRQRSGLLGRLTGGFGGSGRRPLANNDGRASMLERQANVRKLQIYR